MSVLVFLFAAVSERTGTSHASSLEISTPPIAVALGSCHQHDVPTQVHQ
jgi:hypothetical protein